MSSGGDVGADVDSSESIDSIWIVVPLVSGDFRISSARSEKRGEARSVLGVESVIT